MPYKPRFNSARREALWARESFSAHVAGRGPHPLCNLCSLPVRPTDAWDESHHPAHAKVFGGRSTGIAHRRCNQSHAAACVTPARAKADRVRQKFIGAAGPGLGKSPMRGGRRDRVTKTFRHGVQRRTTAAERHAAMLDGLAIRGADGALYGVWAPDPPAE